MNLKAVYRGLLIICVLHMGLFTHVAMSQNVLKGPYLIEPGETNMVIRWEIDTLSDNKVEFGLNTMNTKLIKLNYRGSKHGAYLYEAELAQLQSNSKYYYRLAGHDEHAWYNFKTYANDQEQLRFVAMGDSRSNPEIFARIMQQSSSVNPDFIISMGDVVENGGDYEQWENYFFSITEGVFESTPIISALGDHEGDGDDGELFRYFLRKNEAVDKQWFSFDYGSAHFISLDYRHPENQEMIDWFIEDISSANKKWNFVYMHRPSYNLGGHRSSWGKGIWPELFREYNIDIVFAGHSHLYERFYPTRPKNQPNAFPVTYITTGGAGAGLYEVSTNERVLAKAESVNHFIDVNIIGDTLNLTAFRMNGSLLDEFHIVKNEFGYSNNFTELIIPQEELDMFSMFISSISQSISSLPMYSIPAIYPLHFQLDSVENIPFKVELDHESENNYFMKAVADTLKNNEDKLLMLEIYSRTEMTFSSWGELTPEIRLRLIIEYNSKRDTLYGGAINYWPE